MALQSIQALTACGGSKRRGYEEIYLPKENAVEAALVEGIKVFGAGSLEEVIEHIDELGNKLNEKMGKIRRNPPDLMIIRVRFLNSPRPK